MDGREFIREWKMETLYLSDYQKKNDEQREGGRGEERKREGGRREEKDTVVCLFQMRCGMRKLICWSRLQQSFWTKIPLKNELGRFGRDEKKRRNRRKEGKKKKQTEKTTSKKIVLRTS